MPNRTKKPIFNFVGAVCSIILLGGCIIHAGASHAGASHAGASHAGASHANVSLGEDYSSLNKSLTIDSGKSVGNVSTVNGSLRIEDGVNAENVSSVNGRLRAGDNVSVDDISTVNGSLSIGSGFTANGDVKSVNGKVSIEQNSLVKGKVSTVNGKIELEGVRVEENIETVNGSIYLTDGTQVQGDVVFRWNKKNSKYRGKNPVLIIKDGATIDGKIILERPVDLEFEDDSLLEKVVEDFDNY